MTKTIEKTPAPFARGERVVIREPGIRDRRGTVGGVKWSAVSGWWIDVDQDEGGTWIVPAARVEAATEKDEQRREDEAAEVLSSFRRGRISAKARDAQLSRLGFEYVRKTGAVR